VLGDLRRANVDAGGAGFNHEPHREVACRACHGVVVGHDSHREVECAACHEAAAPPESASIPTAAQCQACHHDPARAQPCGRCHGPAPELPTSTVPVRIAAGGPGTAQTRGLDFEHAAHAALSCESCHGTPPSAAEARACEACHSDHHEATRRCVACHAPLPLDTHTAQAHEGCGGSGCHDDAAVLALPATRSVCLACHQDQAEHEPGRECGPCHRITDGVAMRLELRTGS
jgi:DnaJ-class molecular chaperone